MFRTYRMQHRARLTMTMTLLVSLAACSPRVVLCSDFNVGVGKPAPRLQVGRWLKGEPVNQFVKGRFYIVESWATWCEPCLKSIPHLSALQKKYEKNLSVIGIDVWEEDSSLARPFVAKQGDKMDYAVAQDLVPPGQTFFEAQFAKEWIEGAGKYSVGIPLAFIVNDQGFIAWIGHPNQLDEPLEQITSGAWDLAAATATYDAEMKESSKSEPYKVSYYNCARRGDNNGAASACDSLLQLDSDKFYDWAGKEYSVFYSDAKQPRRAADFAQNAIKKKFYSNPRLLANLARTIARLGVSKDSTELNMAEEAANRACQLVEYKKAFAVGALARVLFAKGDKEKALALQKNAVALAEGMDEKEDMQSLLSFMLQHK